MLAVLSNLSPALTYSPEHTVYYFKPIRISIYRKLVCFHASSVSPHPPTPSLLLVTCEDSCSTHWGVSSWLVWKGDPHFMLVFVSSKSWNKHLFASQYFFISEYIFHINMRIYKKNQTLKTSYLRFFFSPVYNPVELRFEIKVFLRTHFTIYINW